MKSIALIGAGLAAAVAAGASANVTGLQVEYNGLVGGRHVWSVYAVSSNPQNVMLNVIGHTVTAGSMSHVLHNDFGGGTWNPAATFSPEQVANDSFVTVDGNTGFSGLTSLDPSFTPPTGSAIPTNAGWFNGSPGTNIFFTGGRAKIMQVAGNYANELGGNFYTASLQIGYKLNSSSTSPINSPALTYTIGIVPAPGALALLGLAGLAGRRRRA